MTGRARRDAATVSRFLLLWRPPGRSGRFVVGGWTLESWQGGACVWSMELAGLGAYFWVDAELAKVVAARVLRGHRVQEPGWRPCGGNGGPVFLAAGGQDGPRDRPIVVRPAESVHDGPGRRRPAFRTGVPVT
jgi:hypothetical protein